MKYLLAGLLLAAVMVTPACALTQSFTDSIGSTATPWMGQSLTFSQWNPITWAGYTLTKVEINLDATFSNTANWYIEAGTNVTFSAWVDGDIAAYRTWGDNSLLVQADPYGFVGYSGLGPGDGNPAEVIVGTDLNNLYATTLTGDLSAFTGTGTVDLGMTATGDQFYGIGGTNSAGTCVWSTSVATADGTVTYYFEPTGEIPEPATLGLFGMGLLGLGVVVRRRKAAA